MRLHTPGLLLPLRAACLVELRAVLACTGKTFEVVHLSHERLVLSFSGGKLLLRLIQIFRIDNAFLANF